MSTHISGAGQSADAEDISELTHLSILGKKISPLDPYDNVDMASWLPPAAATSVEESESEEDELCIIPSAGAVDEMIKLSNGVDAIQSASRYSLISDGTPDKLLSHRPPPPPPRRPVVPVQSTQELPAPPTQPSLPPPSLPPTVLEGSMKGLMMQGLDRVVEKRRLLRASGAVVSRFLMTRLVAKIRIRKLRAALIIQRMWAMTKTNFYRKRLDVFTMGGLWSVETSSLILALVLGARIRWCFRSAAVRSALASIRQLESVVHDAADASSAFVLTVQKQIKTLKERVYSVFFDDALFVSFPTPGYYVMCRNRKVACKRLLLVTSKVHSSSPTAHEPVSTESHPPTITESPAIPTAESPGAEPDLFKTTGYLAGSLRQKLRSLGSYGDKRNEENSMPAHNDNIIEATPTENSKMPVRNDLSLLRMRSTSPDLPTAYVSPASKRFHTSPSIPLTPEVSESLPSKPASKSSSKSKSVDRCPHVDIHVVAGSKLAPASKSKILRDDSGFPIADRQPTLRIAMSLPRAPGSLEMKEVYKFRYDFQERSLNPNWNHFFRLPLPTLENAFSGLDLAPATDSSVSQSVSLGGDAALESPDSQSRLKYDKDLMSHRRWWSAGLVKIEVVDGDRFNDDIFMGEMTILLSSLLGPRKDVISEWSNAKEFQLQKRNPADRVSGSVSVRMKVEIPSFECLVRSSNSAAQRRKSSSKNANRIYASDTGSPFDKIASTSSDSDSIYSSVDASLLSHSGDKRSAVTPVLGGKLSARISQMKRRGAEPAVESSESPLVPIVRSSRVIRPRDAPSDSGDGVDGGTEGNKAYAEGRPRTSPESLKVHHAAARSRVTQQLQGLEAILSQPTDIMPNYLRKKDILE